MMRKPSFKRTLAALGAMLLPTALFGVANITVQPAASTTVADGAKITLSVTAVSTLGNPLGYTWKKRDGLNPAIVVKAESSSNQFIIASAKAADAGSYFVTVRETQTNDQEDSTPDSVVVVNTRAKITVQPAAPPAAITEGGNVSFTVTIDASGTPDFTYTWQKKVGVNYATVGIPVTKPGLTDTLQLTGVQLSSAGTYRVQITNPSGIVVNSRDIVLKVNSRPVITSQPAPTPIITFGATGILKVVAGGNTPFTYRWLKNGVVIPKSNTANLTIKGTDNAAAGVAEGPGTYKVQIVNAFSPNYPADPKTTDPFTVATFTESTDSVVVVIRKPKIVTQPLKETWSILTGAPLAEQLAVIMDLTGNPGTFQFQWYKDNKIIVGATNSTLDFPAVSWNDRGSYKVIIKNEVGTVTSASAVVTVVTPPIIVSQSPANVFGPTKGTTKLFVNATGTTPIAYAWRFRTINGTYDTVDPKKVISKTNTLSLSNLSNAVHQGFYQCTLTNAPKGFTAPPAVLSAEIYVQVDDPPKITLQTTVLPYDNTITKGTPKIPAGKKLHLQVKATGMDRPADDAPPGTMKANPLTGTWRKNGVAIVANPPGIVTTQVAAAGVTTFELIIDPAVAGDTGKYALDVANLVSKVTSTALTITVSGPPTIVTQPPPVTGIEESQVETTVVASGGSPLLKYQWQKDSGGGVFVNATGKTAAKLLFTSANILDDGIYRCVVSNDFGSTNSATVQVTITPIPSPTLGPVGGISAVELFPAVARTGEKVRIYGQNLNYVKGVKFGGTETASFVIESPNSIVTVVPATASMAGAPIQVSTKNVTPTNTVTLFRRSDEYENTLPNTHIITEKTGTMNRQGDNRYVASTTDPFSGALNYELFCPTVSQVQVFLSNGVIETGQPVDLDLNAFRQATSYNPGTMFLGPNGVTPYPVRANNTSFLIGDDSMVFNTDRANQRVLIRVVGGFAVTSIGYVDFGPFSLIIAVTSLSGSSAGQTTYTRIDPGWQTDGKGGISKLEPAEDAADENDVAMQFGGTDVTSSEPVAIWQPTDASAITGPVIASFDMSLEPGAAEGDDQFAWQVSGQDGSPLAALWVNAADGSLRVVQADGTTATSVQHITPGGGAHRFEITVDPVANTWITLMDGVPVTEPVSLPAGSSFGDISAVWDLGADHTASGASVIFKHFRVEGVTAAP